MTRPHTPDANEGSFIRWQAITIEQLGYAVGLFLTFSTAALGFVLNLIGRPDYLADSWTRICIVCAGVGLFASLVLGGLCVVNRLQDFRQTQSIARDREILTAEGLTRDQVQQRLKKRRDYTVMLGKRTWSLFWWQIGMFAAGALSLVIGLSLIYGARIATISPEAAALVSRGTTQLPEQVKAMNGCALDSGLGAYFVCAAVPENPEAFWSSVQALAVALTLALGLLQFYSFNRTERTKLARQISKDFFTPWQEGVSPGMAFNFLEDLVRVGGATSASNSQIEGRVSMLHNYFTEVGLAWKSKSVDRRLILSYLGYFIERSHEIVPIVVNYLYSSGSRMPKPSMGYLDMLYKAWRKVERQLTE
jgi:hypothetical protein